MRRLIRWYRAYTEPGASVPQGAVLSDALERELLDLSG